MCLYVGSYVVGWVGGRTIQEQKASITAIWEAC